MGYLYESDSVILISDIIGKLSSNSFWVTQNSSILEAVPLHECLGVIMIYNHV